MPELLVIDGQQRLTTISLLLLAITHFLEKHDGLQLEDETWEEIRYTYLVNKYRKDDSKYKILLTRKDKDTYTNLVNGIPLNDTSSKRIRENYDFFVEKINQENIYTVYLGVKKLIIVDVILEREKDNPQLIFESLNSTGLDLSQADLIRNYVLMGLSADTQKDLYEKYWYPMEQSFGDKILYLPWFIRDYLTMKEASIPKIDQVYETYKKLLARLDPNPLDQQTISDPAPITVQAIVDFVKKNTRHPPRIVGLNRVVLDEYPEEAVREAIVNAIAHRNYEDRSRAIMVEVFFDRVVVSSPGSPPQPLTLAKLRRGKYRPCSRNPVVAQSLALLKLMEQRGSGLARMKAAMLDHGLDAPEFAMVDGYFQVVLPGPKDDLDMKGKRKFLQKLCTMGM